MTLEEMAPFKSIAALAVVAAAAAHPSLAFAQAVTLPLTDLVANRPDAVDPAAKRKPEDSQASGEKKESTYDKIWKFAEWYEDDSNPIVQRVLFSGRYQHEFATVDADEGDVDEWNVRRMRLGSRVTLFRRFTFHGELDVEPQERDPFYLRLTDFYLQWSKSGRLVLTLGKHSVPFTMDGATSSKELLTIDRSNLSNNIWFPQEYITGVSASGRRAPWVYRAGV